MKNIEDDIKKIKKIIDDIKPKYTAFGGDIEFVDIKGNFMYVKLKGACGTCQMSMLTMKNWVEATIKREIPEITAVQAV